MAEALLQGAMSDEIIAELRHALLAPEGLVRAVAAGKRRGAQLPWRRIELRPVLCKHVLMLHVVRYNATQAFSQNVPWSAAATTLDALLALPFASWHVTTTTAVLQTRRNKKGQVRLHRQVAANTQHVEHNRPKARLLPADDPIWRALGLATADGAIKPTRQDKFRQVNAFVEALDVVCRDGNLPHPSTHHGPLRVTDLGCGNAYLTFAAYRYLTAVRGLEVVFTGVDVKPEARQRNAALAAALGFNTLQFVAGNIADVNVAAMPPPDWVLALHACDTATDEALARAVQWRARLVLAAPCCHHDLQTRIQRAPEPYGLLTGDGILRERFADVLTDALRASLMRQMGYRTDVIEFIASKHTPRNTLLRCVWTGKPARPQDVAAHEHLLASWHIQPRLAELLENVPPALADH